MSSFGHKIKSASQRDRDFYNLPRGQWAPCLCGSKCKEPVVFVTSYRYVTGRAGRVSFAEKFVCEAHGRKFAAKNGLDVPDPSIPGMDSQKTVLGDAITNALGANRALEQ